MKGEGENRSDSVGVPAREPGRLCALVTPLRFPYSVSSAGTLGLEALPCRETDNLPRTGICEGDIAAILKPDFVHLQINLRNWVDFAVSLR